jgi:cell division transport system permease protein
MQTILRLLRQGAQDLGINPWAHFLALTAVTMVAFLVGLVLMAIITLDDHLGTVRGETVFQVYWRPGADQKIITEQWQNIRHLPGFALLKTYTPAQALKEMEEKLGRSATSKNYPFLAENNPLPPTALLTFVPKEHDYERWFTETSKYLRELPGVERVSSTPLRDELGEAWRKVNSYVMRPAILFLTLVMGLIVGNTIRRSLLSKSQEVEILQLVGAFTWYIRLPLMVCGAILGFCGCALALIMLRFIHMQIYDALSFPPLLMEILFLPLEIIALMLFISTCMGVAGSWLGLRK